MIDPVPSCGVGSGRFSNEPHNTNTMNRNAPEFIHRSKILCTLITPKLGTEVFVQVNTGTIYGLIQGIITEFPGGLDGWDYRVRVTDNSSDIRFSIDDVVDVISRNIFLGQR